MDKKKLLNRKVVTALVLGIGGVAAALGVALPEDRMESIVNVVMMIAGVFL